MPWPEEVKHLEARHICRGEYDGPNGTHCSAGWGRYFFDTEAGSLASKYLEFLDKVQAQAGLKYRHNIAPWNDDKERSKAEIADTINAALADLGYTEVE